MGLDTIRSAAVSLGNGTYNLEHKLAVYRGITMVIVEPKLRPTSYAYDSQIRCIFLVSETDNAGNT